MAGVTTSPITSLRTLRAEVQGLKGDVESAAGVIASAQSAVQSLSASMASGGEAGERFVARVDQVRQKAEETTREIGALEDLYSRVTESSNAWGEELALQIELVRIGGKSLQELITLWGDSLVATEDGNRRLREMFDGANLRQYTDQIQDLIAGLREGGTTVAQVLEYLKTNATQLSKALVDSVEAFRRGEVSLERVQSIIAAIRRDYAGTDLETLAKALEEALRRGAL